MLTAGIATFHDNACEILGHKVRKSSLIRNHKKNVGEQKNHHSLEIIRKMWGNKTTPKKRKEMRDDDMSHDYENGLCRNVKEEPSRSNRNSVLTGCHNGLLAHMHTKCLGNQYSGSIVLD